MDVINLSLGEPEIEPAATSSSRRSTAPRRRASSPRSRPATSSATSGNGSVCSPGQRRRRRSPPRRSTEVSDHDRAVLLGRPDARSRWHEARRDRAGRHDPLVGAAARRARGHRSAARAWPRRTSPARPRCSASAIPTWTVAQIKSALELTGEARPRLARSGEAPTTREGGGRIYLPRANDPLVFAAPSGHLVRPRFAVGEQVARTVALTDAGGGAGAWTRVRRRAGSDEAASA